MLKKFKTFLEELKWQIAYILGPTKSIEQILKEIAEDIEKNGTGGYRVNKLQQGAKLPVESLKLVWNKEDKKK